MKITGNSIFLLALVACLFALQSTQLWGEEKIEIIERPLLADDIPAIRLKPSTEKHGHDEHKKKEPVLLPGQKGKLLIGDRKGNPENGEGIYKKFCVYCHGRKGLGNGPTVIGLNVPPPSYSRDKGLLFMTDQEIFEVITYGRKTNYQLEMPAWGPILSVEERLDVVAFIKELARLTKNENEGERSP